MSAKATGSVRGRLVPIDRRVLAHRGEMIVREAVRARRVVGELDLGGLDASVLRTSGGVCSARVAQIGGSRRLA